ncbi:hypothetical protein [Dysosmobacter sp.]|uniref:hypothetical protein n=1 Tax=Dysosmobacter sp. TaxID=2591382 RepID=UPI002A864577|nr:hypothetical protein [Dysosmobacter sp.]MDY3281802.1 hypothetical protein [Dysosmobacter sp.]
METRFAALLALLCLLLSGCGASAPSGGAGSTAEPSVPEAVPQEEAVGPYGQEAAIDAYSQLMDHFGILLPHEEGFPNYPAGFGDAYYEDGYLWVCLTDDSPEVRQKYLDAVDCPQVLQFRKVDYGYNELYRLSMAIVDTAGVDFASVGPNVMENRVDVGVPDLDRAAEYLDLITQTLPPELAAAFPAELPIVFSQENYATLA